jgi:predicted enzyme related to lactoylglutathione lyase
MPERDTALTGAPCWVDLFTSDPDRSRAFYCELFGWEAQEPNAEFGGYFNFTKNGVLVAGGMANSPDSGTPDVWSVYLETDDAKKAVDDAVTHGGSVIAPAMDIGDLGTMAVITDVGQAAIGIWQPGEHKGFGLVAEPDAPSWFELHTRDYQASVDFYREVFAWDTATVGDTDDFRYTTLGDGETAAAGIMDASGFLPEGVPGHWSVYFGTDDTDAALAKVVELGGQIVVSAEDTPYGRLAQASDPTGARFKLVG